METNGAGISRLDCYEDMFKEITRKLYGEDPDHRTSSVQNEFETSVSYKNDEDTGNGTDGSDEGNWTCEEEPLKGTDGSRIAAYHAGKATWRCYECGDVMSGGPREVAEHFMELHSSRILADDGRNRHHSPRKDYLQMDFKVEDIVSYLDRLRERAERSAPPSRRTQETQTIPAALLPMTPSFLLQEMPSTSAPQHLHQNANSISATASTTTPVKRYTCPCCPYGTDRRDLYTRHENIHREEKPFYCYVCSKPFNRADHVKKHFLRMHRELDYETSKIKKPVGLAAPKPMQQDIPSTSSANLNGQQPQQQHTNYQPAFATNKAYQLQPNTAANTVTGTVGIYQATSMPAPGIMQPDPTNCGTSRRVQNGGCNSKSHLKAGSKGAQERRCLRKKKLYTCCYCPWTGVDNWCLKRHLNTHLKPYACALCEYKAARSERLATHVLKVHNRRQCSKCSFLAEDATQLEIHQHHVHRVNNGNVPSTSTNQTANNRHQQPLHPVAGGRPPPGPPVFPASAPAIAPATTTVIPPSTILGHEMVNSPATAAIMAYPTKEEKRQYSDNDNDGNAIVQGNGNHKERNRDFNTCPVCDSKNDKNKQSCSIRSYGNNKIHVIDIYNSDFTCSYIEKINQDGSMEERSLADSIMNIFIAIDEDYEEFSRKPRKQTQPKKAIENLEEDSEEQTLPLNLKKLQIATNKELATLEESKENYGECKPLRSSQNFLKSYQCPTSINPSKRLFKSNNRASKVKSTTPRL